MTAGRLRVGFWGRFDPLTRLVHGDRYISERELATLNSDSEQHGGARFYSARLALSLRYALSSAGEVFASLPYRVQAMRVRAADEHHRDEALYGPGDVSLGGKYYPIRSRTLLIGGSLGAILPVGRRNPITRLSFVDHDEAEAAGVVLPEHSHLQLGGGVLSPTGGLEVVVRLPAHWLLLASTRATLPLYAASDGYRSAFNLAAKLGAALTSRAPRLLSVLYLTAVMAGRDRLHGEDVVGTRATLTGDIDVPNTGRLELALAPTLTWWVRDRLSATLQARVPFYTRIREDPEALDVQFTERVGVFLGVAYDFDPGE